jgi:hypothetical protein
MYQNVLNQVNSLCGPAYIYFMFSFFIFVVSLIRSIITRKIHFINTVFRLVFLFAVTFVLKWLCEKGYTKFSWFLLYWMFAFVLIMVIGSFIMINNLIKNPEFSKLLSNIDVRKMV